MSDDRVSCRYDHLRLGAHGEDLAERWYRERGYALLDRNWRCRTGEIDLVLALTGPAGTTIVFSEVKTRSTHRFGTPFDAVGRDKQRRLRGLALEWLKANRARAEHLRFDVVGVTGGRIEVIEDAF